LTKDSKPKGPPESFEDLKKEINKKKTVDKKEIIKQITTREKLERDYKEDLLSVSFYSSPETKRMIKSKRPTQSEMMTIMKLSAEATLYEGRIDEKSTQKMVDIYAKLPALAATLSVDRKLDEDFWKESVSFTTLQNFITELIKETQKGSGITEEDMQTFR